MAFFIFIIFIFDKPSLRKMEITFNLYSEDKVKQDTRRKCGHIRNINAEFIDAKEDTMIKLFHVLCNGTWLV